MQDFADVEARKRKAISKTLQVQVFRRDHWLCRWCGRPVVFAPALKYLEKFVRSTGYTGHLAYHDARWRRDNAPLLDHLGAVIDHVEAHARGGANSKENFVTSCNKCNMRKNACSVEEFSNRSPLRRVKAKYGEPDRWDGISILFTLLAAQSRDLATQSDRQWLQALDPNTQDKGVTA